MISGFVSEILNLLYQENRDRDQAVDYTSPSFLACSLANTNLRQGQQLRSRQPLFTI